MASPKPALEKIKELQAQIKALEADAVATLLGEKRNLQDRIAEIDKEIEGITGQPVEKPKAASGKGRGPKKTDPGSLKKPDLQELKDILKGSPDKTLNIRKEGYDTPNIKTLADANPSLLQYTKGAWPTVKLLK
jgi:hypothetical protein